MASKATTSKSSPPPRGGTRTPRTPKNARAVEWADAFFAAFEDSGLVTEACRRAGVGRSTVYDRRHNDEQFAERWADLEEEVTERMEVEAKRRAVEGVERRSYDKDGNLIREEQVYSDTLLIFLLKARRPNTYREHVKVQHTGPGDGPVKHELDISVPAVRQHIDAALAAAQEAEGAATRD